MRKFSALLLLALSGCYSAPQLAPAPTEQYKVPCTGLEPSCRGMNVRITIEKDESVKLSKKEQRQKRSTVFGRCDLVVETAQHLTSTHPCTELRLSLKKPSGEERNTWMQGPSFEIAELTRGPFLFNVYSDQYMTGGSKEKVYPGQALRIEVHLSPPQAQPAPGK